MTDLVNFSELCDYEEFRISYKDHISLMLSEVQRLASPVYLYFSAERPIQSHIVRMEPETGTIVLAHTPDIENVHRIIASGVFVVVDHLHSQIQFHIDGLAQLMDGEGSDYLLPQPDKLYLIQRRSHLRHSIPAKDLACCRVGSETSDRSELPLLDISENGLALLDRECLWSQSKGETISSVDILLPTGTLHCDLEILNGFHIYLASEHRQVCRLGCRIHGMDEGDSILLEQYLESLRS
ncbi:MAG: flagellar brake protein [Gammaproteobacteria bacterium]|nr:flagellar brake protein [Gammaproteobacteria bacterium]